MKHLKLFFALFAMLALGVGNAWGADSGLTASDGVFVIDFYNSDKLTSTNGTNLTTSNYSSFVKVADGLNAKDVVTSVSPSGTVQYNKNGGLTVGSGSNNSHYVTFSIGTDYAVKKVMVYATKYETGRFLLNGKAADSGELGAKNAQFSAVTKPLVWDNLDGVTTLKFTKDNGSDGNQKRLTIYTIVCEYETSSSGGDEPTPSLTATPTTIDFGTVYEGATIADKTVAVNFANLTGAVTYSGLSTPFSATGAIAATGDKITISADASTIGAYSQTLTVASTADSKTAEVTVTMNVVEKPAPTGTFTLHTGDLVEGDYVIVDGTNAMNNTVTSNRLQYNAVTISNNEIVDPLAATIWHIAPNGEYWTIYSAAAEKYAASTDAKNQATLAASVSDNTKWTVTISGNTFDFENLARSNGSDSGNKYLRKNGDYGFACYASGTGAKLSLYRKAGAKYNVTVNSTTNGTVTADPTSAEAGTTITLTVTPDAGYVLDALTVTDASSNPVTVTDNKFTMPASDVTVTATFKENEKPAATLTLSKNGVEETFPGSWKQDDVVTLPSITSDCVKEFVGWSANPTCNVAPEYAAGDLYTLTASAQTLYAVYATAGAGETLTITPSAVSGSADPYTFTIDAAGYSLTAKKNSGSTAPTYTSNEVRVYAKGTVTLTAPKAMGTIVLNISTNGKKRLAPITASVGTIATQASGDATVTWTGDATEVTFTVGDIAEFGSENTKAGQLCFGTITVTTAGSYSNYSTTCAAAPIATVNPTSVTATAAGAEGKVTVTYENVNTANVSVDPFNDAACTEPFTADWLTASLDDDKNNITYTVAENTTYAERKAYIQLTAPEANGTTEPAKVVIPVTQAGKDKVFTSLAELVAADLTAGDEVTVTLNNDVIKEFYIYNSNRAGVVFDVQKDGKDIKIYFNNQTTIVDWAVGGKLSGTLNNVKWTTYSSAWQLAPANTWAWANLTYTEPKAVSTVVVSGAPTKTTYVDGEAFDPAGLTVTVNYNDATTEVNPTGVTFAVTPTTLVKGQTSVSVTATYNSVTSAAYEVTGLTVIDIPTKTVAEFIAAEGGRCYLEGIVSGLTEGNSMKYGNFDLTDASGTIYVYGCLNASGEKEKFAELGVKNGDKIKVIADEYELYGGTKDEAKNVQYVSHVSAASITIANITMEVEEVATISATLDPADAVVTYTIKENAANAISLSGNTITALAEGTATITATVAEGATYLGNSVDFTVTVGPKTVSDEVVILAELDGKWYAMKGAEGSGTGQLAALEVTYFNGTLYNVAEADKASITWTRTIVDGKATFVNNGKYLKGKDGNLSLVTTTDDNCKWTSELGFYTTGNNRTFIYRDGYNFKNYSVQNVGNEGYSGFPEVVAPVYATGDPVYTRSVTRGNYGTICLPYGSSNYSGATFFEIAYQETGKVYIDEVTTLEAGVPYIFQAKSATLTVTCEGEAVADAGSANGLYGTFTEISDVAAVHADKEEFILTGGVIRLCEANCTVPANRAYIVLNEISTEQTPAPVNRRRVGMSVQGENETTGVEDIFTTESPAKVIENGQLIIIRGGVKYNVQGQKL